MDLLEKSVQFHAPGCFTALNSTKLILIFRGDQGPVFVGFQMDNLGMVQVFSSVFPLAVLEFAGSNPAEAVGFFSGVRIILSMPSFGGEVKESVPCPSFAVCKRT